tara:strand:- start:74 stop:544 length:471 start_codon:yes stop_codon:yes gene_type:complete
MKAPQHDSPDRKNKIPAPPPKGKFSERARKILQRESEPQEPISFEASRQKAIDTIGDRARGTKFIQLSLAPLAGNDCDEAHAIGQLLDLLLQWCPRDPAVTWDGDRWLVDAGLSVSYVLLRTLIDEAVQQAAAVQWSLTTVGASGLQQYDAKSRKK